MATMSRRGRLIGVAMVVLAVAAIVAHFGAERLHLEWIRPIAELIILAEILAFIVLERFEIFEPVQESMRDIEGRLGRLEELSQALATAGQVTARASTADMYRSAARMLRDALAADPGSPQIVRTSRLGGRWREPDDRNYLPEDLGAIGEFSAAMHAFEVRPGSASANPWANLWSKRILLAVGDLRSLDALIRRLPTGGENARRDFLLVSDERVSNVTIKLIVRQQPEAALSPFVIVGERQALLSFEDPSHPYPHWGIFFSAERYASLFARWFDEIWQRLDAFTVFSRDGLHHDELERVRRRMQAMSAAGGTSAVAGSREG